MTGKRIGYVRVSTTDQNPDRQLEGIELDKKYVEYASGSSMKRQQLDDLMEYVRDDDIVFVHSVDRLARNIRNLLELVEKFKSKNVELHFIKEDLKFTSKESTLSEKVTLWVFGIVAELERSHILERQRFGIAQAQAQGKYKGRKSKFNPDVREYIINALTTTRMSKSQIAIELNISRHTLYRYMEMMKEEDEKADA